jgi:hypothetical protein
MPIRSDSFHEKRFLDNDLENILVDVVRNMPGDLFIQMRTVLGAAQTNKHSSEKRAESMPPVPQHVNNGLARVRPASRAWHWEEEHRGQVVNG